MDLRAIDRLVAEKVLGWTDIDRKMGGYRPDGRGSFYYDGVPCYSDSIEAAWEVMEKLGLIILVSDPEPSQPRFWIYETDRAFADGDALASADAAPLAICLAALKAKGVAIP